MVTTYIIGGVPRAGKSLVADYLFKKYKIQGMSTDLLREGLRYGVPEFGINSDDMDQTDEERSHILWPYFKGIIKARKDYSDRLVIEGTNFLPELLYEVKDVPYLRICFLGFPNVEEETKFNLMRANEHKGNNWTSEMSDKELMDLVIYLKSLSIEFEKDCKKFGFEFFDTSKNFENVIKEAGEFLAGYGGTYVSGT